MIITNEKIIIKKHELLPSLSIHYPDYGIVVITGKNGVGKSLYLKNIFYVLNNQNIDIKYVDQTNNMIIDSLDVNQNIYLDFQTHPALEFSHLSAKKLSGGERRFVSILRAFYSEADIIMMDEPTNDLDFEYVERLQKLIIKNQEKRLIIIVSHDDRMIEIANEIYEINNGKFIQIRNSNLIKEYNCENYKVIKKKANSKILHKVFKYNFLYLITSIFVFLFLVQCFMKFQKEPVSLIDSIPDQRIDVFIGTVANFDHQLTGAVTLDSFKKLYNEEINIFTDDEAYDLNTYVVFDLETIFDENNLHYYTVEYIDTNDFSNIDTAKLYLDYLQLDSSNCYVKLEGDEEFDLNYDDSFDEISMDREGYENALDQVEFDDSVALVHFVVLLDEDYTLQDFVNHICDYTNQNVFLYCNETIEMMNEYNNALKIKSYLFELLSVFSFFVLIEIIFCFMYLKLHTNRILSLKHYSFKRKNLISWISKMNDFTILKLTVLIIFSMFIFKYINEGMVILNFMPCILLIVSLLIEQLIIKLMVKCHVKKVYSWRFRS